MMRSRTDLEHKSRRNYKSRLDFYVWVSGFFRPVGLTNCPPHATLAKSTTSRHILTRIPTDYEQITEPNKTRIYI